MANVAMLGTGLIGLFYTMSLHGKRSRDRVVVVQGRDPAKTRAFAEKWGIPRCDDEPRGGGLRPGRGRRGDRPAQPPPPRGGHGRRARGQGHPLHQAAGPHRGRGEGDARRRGEGRRLPRLPRGPRLHAEDAEGPRVGPQGRDRPRAVDPLARGAPRAAQRLVLDEGALGRRRHRGHGLPHASRSGGASWARTCARSRWSAGARPRSTRSRPRTRRSASCATRAAPSRSSRWLELPRRHGPARRGLGHRGHHLDQPLAAHRLRDVLGPRPRRLRRREGGDRVGLALPGGRRGGRPRLRRHVRRHARRLRRRSARRWRPSTTATW